MGLLPRREGYWPRAEYQIPPFALGTRFVILHDYPSPPIEKLWRDFLDRLCSGAHYNAPEYFLEPYWTGKRPFAVLAINNGRVVAVVTGLHLQGSVECGVASRPQIAIDESISGLMGGDILAEGLLQEANKEKLVTVYTWDGLKLPGFEQRGFLGRKLEGDVVLDLGLGIEVLYSQLHENRKRNVRIALKNGIEVSEATTPEDLDMYWEVYCAWRKTPRKMIHQNRRREEVDSVQSLRRNHRRFLARYRGRVIAATGVRFFPGGLIEYANNCSLDEFMYLRPNDLLMWRTIQWACEQGFSKYSMGAANPFLRKSGGVVVPIWRYRLDRSFLHHYELEEKLRSRARVLLHGARSNLDQTLRLFREKRSA